MLGYPNISAGSDFPDVPDEHQTRSWTVAKHSQLAGAFEVQCFFSTFGELRFRVTNS